MRRLILLLALLATTTHAETLFQPSQLYSLAQGTIVCRNTAGTGDQEQCTAAQIRTILNVVEGAHTANTDAESKCGGTNVLEGSGACVPNGLSDVVDDPTPQLGGDLDINDYALTGIYTAAVALVDGDYCFLDAAGKMAKVDASAESTTKGLLAMATEAISADATGTFVLIGNYTTTGLTTGSTYYVSTTVGGITATAPSATGNQLRVIGHATSTTNLFINPSQTWIEL